MTPEEQKERTQHRDALMDIQAILKTAAGFRFFEYLAREYDPMFLPPQFLEGPLLYEGLGYRRASVELFKLISEADPAAAGAILAKTMKERYNELLAQQQIDDEQS